MATADSLSASSGPHFAPDDPTLPQPWKGLIDGSTGTHYYWNPETNVTQYERPPPDASIATPNLTLTSVAYPPQSAGIEGQQQQQQHSAPQLIQPVSQSHHHVAMQTAQQQGTQPRQPLGLASQQAVQQVPTVQMQQMPYQQNLAAQRQPIPYQQQGQMSMQQFPWKDDLAYQHGRPGGQPASQMENSGLHSSHVPQSSLHQHAGKEATGYSSNVSSVHVHHGGNDGQQYTSHIASNHPGPSVLQHPQGGSLALRTGYDQNQRAGNDLQYNSSSARGEQGQSTAPKPLFTPSGPVLQNQQPARLPVHVQNGPSGNSFGVNVGTGHLHMPMYNQSSVRPSHNQFQNGSGWDFSKDAGSSDIQNLSAANAYRQQHEITAMGDNVPAPFMTFGDTGFPPEILREINMAGFTFPTPIQAQTWPIALQSRDIVAIAKTGSGKTLGYLIPAFINLRLRRSGPQVGPSVLVLAPTRELATQILDEVIKFGRSSRVSCTCLYGGASKALQLRELERGVDIVVATPGRLNDILCMGKINLSQVSFLVLDEADRMLDMGFEPQIQKIVEYIPRERQTLMYTATWPKEVKKIAGDLLVNPVQVNIGSVDELAANKSITQYVEVISQPDKQRRLEHILMSREPECKVIIFCATKKQCDHLVRSLGRNFRAVSIHGDKSQNERDWVLNQFKSGKISILVATDVAARGLDIKDIRVVINYDFPNGVEDYVHRIGRTGRAGATGVAFSFLSDQDRKNAADLVKVLEGANQQVPPEVREMAARAAQFSKDRGAMNRRDSNGGSLWEPRDFSGGRGNGFGGRGGRDSVGRGGGRDNGFGVGRGGSRDNGFGVGRGGDRDVGYVGGRGRDNGYGGRYGGGGDHGFNSGRGYRNDFSGGRGARGRGFSGPGGRGQIERNPSNFDREERFDSRRGNRSRSPSTYRGRSRGYNRSSSRSWSRSRSRSWSRSRSRSWSRSRSRSRSSRSRSPVVRGERKRSRSNSHGMRENLADRSDHVHEPKIARRATGFSSPNRISEARDVLPSASRIAPPDEPLPPVNQNFDTPGDA